MRRMNKKERTFEIFLQLHWYLIDKYANVPMFEIESTSRTAIEIENIFDEYYKRTQAKGDDDE